MEMYADFIGRVWQSGAVFKLELVSRSSPDPSETQVAATLVLPAAALRELAVRLREFADANDEPQRSNAASSESSDDLITLQTISS